MPACPRPPARSAHLRQDYQSVLWIKFLTRGRANKMYQTQCSCFCGCGEMLTFDTKPGGDPVCRRCKNGDCIHAYAQTHTLEDLMRRTAEKLQTCVDTAEEIKARLAALIGP